MHTPEQAKELWCPMARVTQIGAVETNATYNRALVKTHIPVALKASEVDELIEDQKPFAATMLKVETQISGAAHCISDKCAMWRSVPKNGPFIAIVDDGGGMKREVQQWGGVPPTHGYCGLAGSVHGVAA
jgi:hypothetical protein